MFTDPIGAELGTPRIATIPVMIGNRITAVCDTGFATGIGIARSLFVVSNRMIGG